MKRIIPFEQFMNEELSFLNFRNFLNEKYQYKNLKLGNITYKDLYDYIHDRMWKVAKNMVYGKEFMSDPLNNNIIIKYGTDEIKASELFYVLWSNIDQYTSNRNINREDLEGKMEYLSDGSSRDYRNQEWYIQLQAEQAINAGYYSTGYLGSLVDNLINMLNRYGTWDMKLSHKMRKYNLENPENVKTLARSGQLREILRMESYYETVTDILKIVNQKDECVEAYKKQTADGVVENPAFGMEDYLDALSNARGFLQMKLKRPDTTAATIGWNILNYINEFIYEFALHYFAKTFSQSVTGYEN